MNARWNRQCAAAAAALLVGAVAAQQASIAGTVRWPERRPAANAEITVRWRVHPELPGMVGASLGVHGAATKQTTTDAAGRWRVDVPGRGPFAVTARTADGQAAASRAFPVMAGGYVEHVLEPACRVRGLVRSKAGEPLPGFAVHLAPARTTWSRLAVYGLPMFAQRVTSGDDGCFEFELDASYLRAALWEPFLSPSPERPTEQFLRIDVLKPTLAGRSLELIAHAPPATKGVVRDAAGVQLAGVRVFERREPWRFVTTGDDGRFELATRAPKSLAATLPDFAAALSPQVERRADGGNDVEFTLQAPRRATLRLLDDHGEPLANHDVLTAAMFDSEPPIERLTRTDENGRTVLLGGGGATIAGFVRVDGVFLRFFCDGIAADQERNVAVRARLVRGIVTSAAGTPQPGARVVARASRAPDGPAADGAASDGAAPCWWVTYTDAGGRYEFAGLPAGTLAIAVDAGTSGLTTGILAADTDRLDQQLEADGIVEIEVLDAVDQPVAGAWVTLILANARGRGFAPAPSQSGTAIVGHSDANGRVRFCGLPSGQWTVIGHVLIEGRLFGNRTEASTGDVGVVLRMKPQRG